MDFPSGLQYVPPPAFVNGRVPLEMRTVSRPAFRASSTVARTQTSSASPPTHKRLILSFWSRIKSPVS